MKKALSVAAAVAAMAAAAGVCVVAAAFALYAWIRSYLSPAEAAAVIAALAAVSALIFAFIAYAKVRPSRRERDDDVVGRVIDLARERPIIAAGAAAAVGLVLLRNPGAVAALVTGIMASRSRGADRRKYRR